MKRNALSCIFLAACAAVVSSYPRGIASAAETAQPSRSDAAIESAYDGFLFVRAGGADDASRSWTLAMGQVLADGFDLRDVWTTSRTLSRGFDPLCVENGTLYALNRADLISVDLESGQVGIIRSRLSRRDVSHEASLLCVVRRSEEAVELQAFDFRIGAFRDYSIPGIRRNAGFFSWPAVALSPDGRRAAATAAAPMDETRARNVGIDPCFRIHFLDLDTGQVAASSEPWRYPRVMTGSGVVPPPSCAWIDDRTLLFATSGIPDGQGGPGELRGIGVLAKADALTGKTDKAVSLPEHSLLGGPRLQRGTDGSVFVSLAVKPAGNPPGGMSQWNTIRYRVDLDAGKLVEDDSVGGQYRLSQDRERVLRCEGQVLPGTMRRGREFAISPDGRRALWIAAEQVDPYAPRSAPGFEDALWFHDAATSQSREIAKGRVAGESLFWFASDALTRREPPGALPAGWMPIESLPQPEPKAERPKEDDRLDAAAHFSLRVEIDKPAYRLHEPVLVTVTVANTGETEEDVVKPHVFSGISGGIVDFRIDCPVKTGSVSYGAEPYEPAREKIALKPGESVCASDALEVSREGKYRIEIEYHGHNPERTFNKWKGKVIAPAVEFTVARSADDAALYDAKFDRLLAKLGEQYLMAPDWPRPNTSNDVATDDLTGFPGMGGDVALRLARVLREAPDDQERGFRCLLLKAVVACKDPATIPCLEKALSSGTEGDRELACRGLMDLWESNRGKEQVLSALLKAMDDPQTEVRRETAKTLARIRSELAVRDRFEKALEDPDAEVRVCAARYLAEAEGIGLADFLLAAAAEPTRARYVAAQSIVADLEKQWRAKRGPMPGLDYDAASPSPDAMLQYAVTLRAWAEWAQENPAFSDSFFGRDVPTPRRP